MNAGVKTPQCPHLSSHFCISSTTINSGSRSSTRSRSSSRRSSNSRSCIGSSSTSRCRV